MTETEHKELLAYKVFRSQVEKAFEDWPSPYFYTEHHKIRLALEALYRSLATITKNPLDI